MVTIPISPLVCSVLTAFVLIVTFYVGRWFGVRWCAEQLMEAMEKSE